MAITSFTNLLDTWSADNRFTATTATDILLSNGGRGLVYWVTSMDDTVPINPTHEGPRITPNDGRPIQLKAGERLWIARQRAGAQASVLV